MDGHGMSENEALDWIQKTAMNGRGQAKDIAEQVIAGTIAPDADGALAGRWPHPGPRAAAGASCESTATRRRTGRYSPIPPTWPPCPRAEQRRAGKEGGRP